MNLSFLSSLNHLWIRAFVFKWLLIDSSELFVCGISKSGCFSYIYRYGKLLFILLYALRTLSCLYLPFSFFSISRSLWRIYQLSNHITIDLSLNFQIDNHISFSSIAASYFGLLVRYLITILWQCLTHICTGISQNPHSNHLLQSHTIARIFNHSHCINLIHSLYLSFVSYTTLYRNTFFLLCLSLCRILKIIYQYFLPKYVVSIITIASHFSRLSKKNYQIELHPTSSVLSECWHLPIMTFDDILPHF
jgi:hypothetical protein